MVPRALAVRFALCVVVGLAACSTPPAAGVTVERHAVTLNLLVDGSIEVREALTVRFAGEPVSGFDRHVARWRADAFFDVHVALDGKPVDATSEPARADADASDALIVHWDFPPVSGGTHEFTLEYRAANAISVHGANGVFRWPLAPLHPTYPVEVSEVALTVPRGTVFMEQPSIETVETTDATGATAPWSLTPGQAGLTASRAGTSTDESAILMVRMAVDTLSLAEPRWQYDAARAEQLMPAWASGGLFMVVIGLGAIVMLRVQFPDHRRGLGERQEPVTAPDRPSPAVAAALVRRRRGRAGSEIPVALQGLLDRGAIAVEGPGRDGTGLRPEDRIILAEVPDALLEHERALVDELWLQKGGAGVKVRDLRASRRVRRTFATALTRDLTGAGYAGSDRVVASDGLWVAAFVIMALAVLCAAAIPVVLGRYGVWPYAVPAGIFVMGLVMLPFAATFSILTEAGERASRAAERRE